MKTSAAILAALALLPAGAVAQATETATDSVGPIAVAYRPIEGDTTRPPAEFVDVDKEPAVVKKVEPVYPASALKAGMEGKVWVKIWVDSQGNARKVLILRSDAEIFNSSAIAAARQFKFTPAEIKGKPVDVWVSVPFKYRLAEKADASSLKADTAVGGSLHGLIRFIGDVLQGPVPDTARVAAFLADDAVSIAGGRQLPLRRSIEEQGKGRWSLEQQGRKMVNITLGMGRGEKSGYIIARTEKGAKENSSHYHTIVFQQVTEGEWKIMCWQSWQGGRTSQ
ncbi:MAG TPA: energy transducer TonB [Bacteroidota bacterium]|nr:energy transducer TonB [Bacteroidota bacterium]